MRFRREQIKDYFLLDTQVENIFINEYMASAPGDYVKIYLFALMYADLGQEMENEIIAKQLGMQEEDVLKAWSYWESMGVIRKHRKVAEDKFNYQVEFVNLKELLYGKTPKKKKKALDENAKVVLEDKEVQGMYRSIERILGRGISSTEAMEILSWINDFNAPPEIIVFACSYCKAKEKKNIKYIAAVVKRWVSEGLTDVRAVEEHLKDSDQRHYLYKRVCKALGFSRNSTEEEQRIMDQWFDNMNYTIDKVLEACGKTSGISNPNINYVNKILTNWYEEKSGKTVDGKAKSVSVSSVLKYYDHLRQTEEEELDARKQEVYSKLPRIQDIEAEMNSCSTGMSKIIISNKINKDVEIKKLQDAVKSLNRERAVLLTDNSFELDYLDMHYKCRICKDTGTTDEGERCQCFQLRAKEAELWQRNLAKE